MTVVTASEIAGWLPVLILTLTVAVFLRRRLYRKFPLFFSYVVVSELIAGIRHLAGRLSYGIFFYVYWTSDVVLTIFAFLALYELFIGTLFARFYKVRFYRLLFPLAAVVMLGFTTLTALRAPRAAAILVAAHTFVILRAVILMFFVLLVLVMGREWKRHEFAIALGFGLYASVLVGYAAIELKAHNKRNDAYTLLLYIAYDVVCLIWLSGFWVPEKVPPNSDGMANPELLNEAKKWEGVLKDWLKPKKR